MTDARGYTGPAASKEFAREGTGAVCPDSDPQAAAGAGRLAAAERWAAAPPGGDLTRSAGRDRTGAGGRAPVPRRSSAAGLARGAESPRVADYRAAPDADFVIGRLLPLAGEAVA